MCYIWKLCWLNTKILIVEIFINCQNNEEGDFERIQTFKEILLVYVKER